MRERRPMRTSVFRLRSWASSMMTHEYCRSRKSDCGKRFQVLGFQGFDVQNTDKHNAPLVTLEAAFSTCNW